MMRLFRSKNLVALLIAISVAIGCIRSPNSALFLAASKGKVEEAKRLLDQGVNVNAREEEKETPLMYAAVEGHNNVVLLLLSRGADINAISANNETALCRAARAGELAVVKTLIERGAAIEIGTSPLIGASAGGHVEIVELLLDHGAKVDDEDEAGYTALSAAAIRGTSKEVCGKLIARGADVNHRDKRGKTPEELAKENGNEDIAKLIKIARQEYPGRNR